MPGGTCENLDRDALLIFWGGLNMLLFGVAGNWNYVLGLIENLPYFCIWVIKLTIVPQLSKCLKFEAVWGVLTDQIV